MSQKGECWSKIFVLVFVLYLSFIQNKKDLVDFLNDAGPLQREVSKDLTSDKVYDSLQEEDEQRRQLKEEARQRKRRRMPMVENLQSPSNNNSNDMLEGMTVERTTNFSEAIKEEENEDDVRLSDEELFDLVWNLQKNETTVEKYLLEEKKSGQQQDGSSNMSQVKMEQNMKLLENVKKYCEIPILMQDADMALIGAPEHKIEILKFDNVRMAPSHIQLSYLVESMQDKLQKQKLKEATVVK